MLISPFWKCMSCCTISYAKLHGNLRVYIPGETISFQGSIRKFNKDSSETMAPVPSTPRVSQVVPNPPIEAESTTRESFHYYCQRKLLRL